MSQERIRSYQWYMAWEYDLEEQMLDKKSRDGWQLEKGGCFYSTFVKDSSVCYRHRLDYNPDAMKTQQEKERYIAAFADGGWEFVNATFNGWIYLRKPYQEDMSEQEFEIYSDGDSLLEMFKRFEKLGNLLSILLIVNMLLELSLAANGSGIAGIICAAFLALVFVWMRKGIRTLKLKQELLSEKLQKKS